MGLSNYETVKRWRARNKDKVAAQNRRRKVRRREHIRAQQKAWRLRNIEKCRKREATYARSWRMKNREAQRIRMARFKAKLREQQLAKAGRPPSEFCELCGEKARTVYDHDHDTGSFRGWLCDRCNRTLGQVHDDIELLGKMIAYLIDGGVRGDVNRSAAEPIASKGIRGA